MPSNEFESPTPIELQAAYKNYFMALPCKNQPAFLSRLDNSAEMLATSERLLTDVLAGDAEEISEAVQSGGEINEEILDQIYDNAFTAYIYSGLAIDTQFIKVQLKRLDLDKHWLQEKITPSRSALKEHDPERLFDRKQLRFYGKSALRLLGLQSRRARLADMLRSVRPPLHGSLSAANGVVNPDESHDKDYSE